MAAPQFLIYRTLISVRISTSERRRIPNKDVSDLMIRIIWVLYGITIAVVTLRLYTQGRITRSLGLGDAMMALSLASWALLCPWTQPSWHLADSEQAFGIALVSNATVQYHYGLGRHFFYLDPYQQAQAAKFSFVGQPIGKLLPSFPVSKSGLTYISQVSWHQHLVEWRPVS